MKVEQFAEYIIHMHMYVKASVRSMSWHALMGLPKAFQYQKVSCRNDKYPPHGKEQVASSSEEEASSCAPPPEMSPSSLYQTRLHHQIV